MAAAIGALNIDLALNSAAFIRDMGKSQKALATNSARMNKALARLDRGFTRVLRSVKRTAKSMVSMRGIMAGVAGAAGIGFLVKKSIEFADKIGKTADQIGITTAALQEYRFALDLSGVATETTDKGLTKFVRNMGELGRTSSETQTALKDLDPALLANLRSLKSVEEQLAAGFRALAGYTNQQQRAAVAASLFGRAGVKMTVGVKNGIEAFEGLQQRARNLGLVLEDKLIRNAETANDELTVLAEVIKVKLVGAVIAFAPQITDLATRFAEGIPKIVAWVEAFGKFVGLIDKTRVERISEIVDEIDRLQKKMAEASDESLGPDFIVGQDTVQGLRLEIAALRAELERLLAVGREARAGISGATPAPTPGAPSVDTSGIKRTKFRPAHEDADLTSGFEQAIRLRRELATAEFNTAEAIRATTVDMLRQADQTAVLTAATRQGADALRAQTEIFELQNAALAQGVDLTTEQGQAWEAAFRRLQIFNNGLEETQRQMEENNLAAQRSADTISGVLDQALQGNIRSWKDLGRVAIGVIQDILREQLRAAAAAQAGGGGGFFKSIFGSIAGLFGGGGGGGGGAASNVVGPGFFNFAHGGRATVGGSGGTDSKLAVLRVTPREDITVRTPEQQRKAAAGRGATRGAGITIVQSFDFRGAEPGVFARAQVFKEEIKAETIDAVFRLIGEGGSEAKISGRRARR